MYKEKRTRWVLVVLLLVGGGLFICHKSGIKITLEKVTTIVTSAEDKSISKMEDPVILGKIITAMHEPAPFGQQKLSVQVPSGHYAQFKQSQYIDALLKQKTNGFFIECGATDGQSLSNSLFFELKRNWTGLLVEANPTFFKTLMSRKRHAYAINVCLSPVREPVLLQFLNKGVLGSIVGFNDTAIKPGKEKGSEKRTQCYPLYSILLAIGHTRIDFFSLDIEGSELVVLKTIPFDKIFIDVILLEHVAYGSNKDPKETMREYEEFFQSTGLYRRIDVLFIDVVYRHI